MNSVDELIDALTPEMVSDLKRAIERGKFPDGRPVSAEQRALMLEAVIRYEDGHLPVTERTGFVDKGASQCATPAPFADQIVLKEVSDD